MRGFGFTIVSFCASLLFSNLALGQAYPNHSITLVVPFTAGSGPDILARAISAPLSERWGQPLIVENKPGATGDIGARAVARAPADGYTLLLTISGGFVITPAVNKSLPYDPIKDFAPIVEIATGGLALVVNPTVLPVKTLDALVATARKEPGKLNFASAGVGSQPHLAVEVLKKKFGLDMLHVPHKGQAQAVTELLAGRIHLMMLPVHTALPYVRAGKLQVLAVSGKSRSVLAPDLPTFAEVGVPDLQSDLYYWVAAPAGTPADIVTKLHQSISAVMASPDVKDQLLKQGLVAKTGTTEEITSQIAKDIDWWKKFVSETKIVD